MTARAHTVERLTPWGSEFQKLRLSLDSGGVEASPVLFVFVATRTGGLKTRRPFLVRRAARFIIVGLKRNRDDCHFRPPRLSSLYSHQRAGAILATAHAP